MNMTHSERMNLIRFVCNAAWQDVQIQEQEKSHILRLCERMGLDEADMERVHRWLKAPPPIDSVDPSRIPLHLAPELLRELEDLVSVDGVIAEEEADMLDLLRELLLPQDDE